MSTLIDRAEPDTEPEAERDAEPVAVPRPIASPTLDIVVPVYDEEQILEQQGFGRRCIHEVDLAHREPSAGCRPDQGLRRTSRPFGDPPRGRVVPSGAWVGVGVHGSCGWETVRRRRTRARSSGRSSCIRTTRRGVEAGPTTA